MPTDPVNAVQGVYDKTPNRQNVETAKYRYDRRSKILKFENNVEKDRKNIENIELFQFIVMKFLIEMLVILYAIPCKLRAGGNCVFSTFPLYKFF